MRSARGVTLIDTVVGVALLLLVFVGISAVFRLSIDVVTNNKARAGAIALADQRMEYIRSLTYPSVGTQGGIPTGLIAPSESISLNGVSYTRRTVVTYADDPKDGIDASDSNGVTEDYKAVKVDVAWTSRLGGTRHVDLVARVSPPTSAGETNPCASSCGTLSINVVNASNKALAGASVTITNSTSNPAVNFNTFTNANGTVTLLAAPASAGYGVVVTNTGYSTDQTGTGANASRLPLTVSNNLTTSATFQIDGLSSMAVVTYQYGTLLPITSVPFSIHGAKTTSSNPVTYKYSATLGGTGSPATTISNLEWDTYTFAVAAATGYDLAYSCGPQPIALSPNTATTTYLYLATHTSNSLAVKVSASADSGLIGGASVRLFKSGYDTTQITDSCGQTFFSGLSSGTYTLSVSASGHTTFTNANLSVASSTQSQVSLN